MSPENTYQTTTVKDKKSSSEAQHIDTATIKVYANVQTLAHLEAPLK